MTKEQVLICKHEIVKLMRSYEALDGISRPLDDIVKQNAHAIYLLAEIVKELLKDKE